MNSILMLLITTTPVQTYSSYNNGVGVLGVLLGSLLSFVPFIVLTILWGIIMLLVLAIVVVTMIGEFKVLKKLGYEKAWFAFIPFLCAYAIVDVADDKVFNLGVFKISNRKTAALITALAPAGVFVVTMFIWLLNFIPIIGFIIWMIYVLILPLVGVAMRAFTWRGYYDLYAWYYDKSQLIAFSIIAVFVPLFSTVLWFILMKKEPQYRYEIPTVTEEI